jgi:hypothetical protein
MDHAPRPSRRLARHLAILGAVITALILATVVPAQAASSTFSPSYLAGGRVSSGAVIRPRHVVLSGDSTLWLTRAHWRTWGHWQGLGHARSHWDNCIPNCAAGKITVKPAQITLSRPRHRCGKWFYTRVKFHFTAGRPPGITQDYRWNAAPICA